MRTTIRLKIEKNTAADNNIRSVFKSMIKYVLWAGYDPKNNPEQRQVLVNKLQQYLLSLKVGSGSSHIWISNQNNERLAVIYL